MRPRRLSNFGLLVFFITLFIALCAPSSAQQKSAEVIAMTTPFGTAGYTVTMAFEQTFKKANSWVKWRTKETPGAMYIFRYTAVNREEISAGKHPHVVIPIQGGLLGYVIEGRPPFQEIPNPDLRALFYMDTAVYS